MTVIAWDGKTLAADKRGSNNGNPRTVTKIRRIGDFLAGFAGEASMGQQLFAWLRAGAQPDCFPASQTDADDAVEMLVVRPGGVVQKYWRTPYPITFEDPFIAIGCGRDYALAAMHLGKSAREAVEVACALDVFCGNGIDTLEFGQ